MRSSGIIVLFLALLLTAPHEEVIAQGQQGSGSPYSAYGFGNLVGATQVSQALMAGTGVALTDPFSVIRINPASYASMARPAFEAGIASHFLRFETPEATRRGRRMDILGFSIGIPFGNNRWGLALGMNPESTVGYDLSDVRPLLVGEGDVTFAYSGTGGLNRAFAGIGHTVWQKRDTLGNGSKLSFGANLNYLFGNIQESRRAFYPENQGYYNSAIVSTLILRDPGATAGVQFQGDIVKRKGLEDDGFRYLLGFSAELPSRLNARRSETIYSFIQGSGGIEFPVDTISYVEGAKGHVTLPVQLAMGLTLYNSRWTVTLEHRRRDWDRLAFEVEGVDISNQLGNAATYMIGGALRPAGMDRGNFWSSTIYRAGLRYTDDYLVVAGDQLREIGMSFGLSMPVMGISTRSRLSLGAELGDQGGTGVGAVNVRYATLLIGITVTPDIREQWFKKRRIE